MPGWYALKKKYEWMNSCAWMRSLSLICNWLEGKSFTYRSANRTEQKPEHQPMSTVVGQQTQSGLWVTGETLGLKRDISAPEVGCAQQFGQISWWNRCLMSILTIQRMHVYFLKFSWWGMQPKQPECCDQLEVQREVRVTKKNKTTFSDC